MNTYNFFEYKISTILAFMFVVLFILPMGLFVWRQFDKVIFEMESNSLAYSLEGVRDYKVLSTTEKTKIQGWIKTNNLDRYGDPADTIYAGGTPLLDEKTQKITDLYDYILRRHPNRPWLKSSS